MSPFPPLAGDLLVCSLDKVGTWEGCQVADDGRLNVDFRFHRDIRHFTIAQPV